MTVAQGTDELKGLLDQLERGYKPAEDGLAEIEGTMGCDRTLTVFLQSFMLWETTSSRAHAAMKRLEEAVVDVNELRICLPDEISRVIGERYAKSRDRSLRLKASLTDLFGREHTVSMAPLRDMSKREAKEYLDSLEGVPPFVAARVVLLGLGGHAAPVDGRLTTALARDGIVDSGTDPSDVAGFLERRLRAKELLGAHRLLQAWSDDGGPSVLSTKPRSKSTKPRKTK